MCFDVSCLQPKKNATECAKISYQIILMRQRNYCEAFTHMNQTQYEAKAWGNSTALKMSLIPSFKIFTLLPNISASKSVTVNWVWEKNMMYNKSGLAGDWRNNLREKRNKKAKCKLLLENRIQVNSFRFRTLKRIQQKERKQTKKLQQWNVWFNFI